MTLTIYSFSHYSFGSKEDSSIEEKESKLDKMVKLRNIFESQGMVRSVRLVVLIHEQNHPSILIFKKKNENSFILPGGKLEPGEDEESGIQRILEKKLQSGNFNFDEVQHLSTWYRPYYTTSFYPYLPVHITSPKETEKWYIVSLPETLKMKIPSKYELISISFYDLNANTTSFGYQLSTIPILLSKFDFIFK